MKKFFGMLIRFILSFGLAFCCFFQLAHYIETLTAFNVNLFPFVLCFIGFGLGFVWFCKLLEATLK